MMNHGDTETRRKTKNLLTIENEVSTLCLCASVVRFYSLVLT